MGEKRKQTAIEESLNTLVHGAGFGLAIAASIALVISANKHGSVWHLASFSIYGATLIVLYLSSTLYHSLPEGNCKNKLRVIDHSSIFLLIAGTYTPITLTAMRGPWGWSIFGVVWGIALAGIMIKIFWFEKLRRMSTLMYAAMGWIILIAIRPLLDSVNATSLIFLLAGGLAYSLGIVFYASQKLKFNHAIWHMFVLAGSVCHFFTVLHLLPGSGAGPR
jgi:hemolysin III